MKLTPPHWVMSALLLLVFVEPKAAELFPAAAATLGVLEKVMVLAITVLGGASASAFPTVNSKAVAARTAQVLGAVMFVLFVAIGVACTPAQAAEWSRAEQDVAADLSDGASESQMASDVCRDFGGSALTDAACANVPLVLQDIISLLVDTGKVSGTALANAKAFQARHMAAKASP